MGIATTGMMTARNEPRNRKMTTMTIRSVSLSVLMTSLMASSMYLGRVVRHAHFHTGRQLRLDFRYRLAHLANHVERVGRRQHPDAHERGGLSVEADVLLVVLRAQHDVGDIAEADDDAVLLFDDELPEFFRRARRSVFAIRLTDTIEPFVRPSAER